MGALRVFCVSVMLLMSAPAQADRLDQWRPYIAEASARFGIPEDWIIRVMRAESGGRTTFDGRPITSRKGAMGLMQLMPGTWAEMRVANRLGADPHDPRDNIIAGTAYLRLMHDRFGHPGLFAAYNAGPGRYAEHLATGRALPGETRAYLASVAGGGVAQGALVEQKVDSLFFVLRSPLATSADRSARAPNRSLFISFGATADRGDQAAE